MEALEQLFWAAVGAAQPERCLPAHLPDPPKGRTIVVGAGKAASAMAAAVEKHYAAPVTGLMVTRDGHVLRTRDIEIVEASHPVPDARGETAARRIMAAVDGLTEDDLVICLLSGGASALLPLPAKGVTLQDKQAVTEALLKSGATISEINLVRRHLSAIKGGRLAEAARPAQLVTLAISDVPGDDPLAIGSGPTIVDPTRAEDARDVLERYGIQASGRVENALSREEAETKEPWGDYRLIATPAMALDAAAAKAIELGYQPVMLGDALEGEASLVAVEHALLAKSYRDKGQRVALISGGELTVKVSGSGTGGPNHEYALALMSALDADPAISAMACDTDGSDGTTQAAGAWFTGATSHLAASLDENPVSALERHDSGGFFRATGHQLVTGPTQTNVNDFRAILIDP